MNYLQKWCEEIAGLIKVYTHLEQEIEELQELKELKNRMFLNEFIVNTLYKNFQCF